MTIKELFEKAIADDHSDLQALIMFLVFEKEVLSMEDDTRELDLYFLKKHTERMNQELAQYRQKMNFEYPISVFEVVGNGSTLYIRAKDHDKARLIASRYLDNIKIVKVIDGSEVVIYKGSEMKLKNVAKSNDEFLGGNEYEIIRT